MEPQLPKPQFSSEAAPSMQPRVSNGETFVAPRAPEVAAPVEQGRETREVFVDNSQGGGPAAPAQSFTPPPMPAIVSADDTAGLSKDDTNPTIAADDDLIEKEWVEKAKQVVAETRNDPHAQDAAVGRLQADYLKKRYGKIIATSKEG